MTFQSSNNNQQQLIISYNIDRASEKCFTVALVVDLFVCQSVYL